MDQETDKKAARAERQEARRKAAAAKLWGEGRSTGDAERDADTARQVWEQYAAHAKQHLEANRTIYVVWINLGHTSVAPASSPSR